MACACKGNQKIDYIHRKYGYNKEKNLKRSKIRQNIKILLKDIIVWMVLLPLIPFIVLHILCITIFTKEKKISVSRLLKIKGYGK